MDNSDLLGAEYAPPANPVDFVPRPPRAPQVMVVLPPDPTKMEVKIGKMVTQNKIRQAFSQLSHNNLDAVQSWLHKVADDSPAKAIELFIELAKFCLPQLKETAVTVTQNNQTRTFRSSEDILAELNNTGE